VLTASGPGSELFHGRIDNTRVFRNMVTALGLKPTDGDHRAQAQP
jgi:alkaline phosphatase